MSTQRSKRGPQGGREWPEGHRQLGVEWAQGPRSGRQSLAPSAPSVLEQTQAKPGQVSERTRPWAVAKLRPRSLESTQACHLSPKAPSSDSHFQQQVVSPLLRKKIPLKSALSPLCLPLPLCSERHHHLLPRQPYHPPPACCHSCQPPRSLPHAKTGRSSTR